MGLSLYKEIGSLSRVIRKVLSVLMPVIEKEHKWGKQRISRYMVVSGNPEEKREHVHGYFPGKMYRRLKLMHQDLNFYSIAQVVRSFLEVFLDLGRVYGDDVFKELERILKKWKEENHHNHLTIHDFLRQLNIILQHLPIQDRVISVYDSHYSPFWTFRL